MDAPKRGYRDLTVRDDQGRKECGRCELWLDDSSFHRSVNRSDGLMRDCKTCEASKKRMVLYGLTADDVSRMWDQQDGRCPICKEDLGDRYAVDHDHLTGENRELLCNFCNVLLGYARENVTTLESAIDYLKKHGGL